MEIRKNSAKEWLFKKSVIKIEDTLEHWLNQQQYSPEFRNGLIKLKGIPFEKVLLKVIEINFDDLDNLPSEVTFGNKSLQSFDEALQKLSITSDNTG